MAQGVFKVKMFVVHS